MNLLSHIENALFISSHPDDSEFGAAGLIQVLLEKSINPHLLVMSNPVESLPVGYSPNTFFDEQINAAKICGISSENVKFLDFPVRNFPQHRQPILEGILEVKNRINPELIISSSQTDFHQDHNTVANEVIRAFKNQIILGYTHQWNTRSIVGNVFFEISENQLATKICALKQFRSQNGRAYSNPEVTRSMAIEAGVATGFQFAERFELITMSIPS